MKKLLLLSILAIYTQINAQNVGIGNPAPTEKLDVTGNINVTGTIKANGAGGTANQVLSKNATNNLAWVNTANANDIRFRGVFTDITGTSNGTANTLSLFSSLNSTIVYSAGGNSIVINKTGLYHFDFNINVVISSPANPVNRPFINLFADINSNNSLDVGLFWPINLSDNSSWQLRGSKSFELHVVAPATVTIPFVISGMSGPSKNLRVEMLGHLISE